MIRTITATRYLAPLREGGSLPAIVEADDERLYVLKFRGAGQGPKVLIAELLAGEIGRALGLPVPEIVFVELDAAFGRNEPHEEIQDLLRASVGLNLALAYIPGALAFEPLLAPPAALALASAIVWFDAYTTNVDRTPRNTNMLLQEQRLWLIDHGAALFVHHAWGDYMARSRSRFPQVKDHILLPYADALPEADAVLSERIAPDLIERLVGLIPDSWLAAEARFADHDEHRAAYASYLLSRLQAPRAFVEEAVDARAKLV
ncbi:MAG: aminotransferase class I and II [Kouleothrix sp.]|nr:aminotransferase class I and II [Kouleothrix sp.]